MYVKEVNECKNDNLNKQKITNPHSMYYIHAGCEINIIIIFP